MKSARKILRDYMKRQNLLDLLAGVDYLLLHQMADFAGTTNEPETKSFFN